MPWGLFCVFKNIQYPLFILRILHCRILTLFSIRIANLFRNYLNIPTVRYACFGAFPHEAFSHFMVAVCCTLRPSHQAAHSFLKYRYSLSSVRVPLSLVSEIKDSKKRFAAYEYVQSLFR